ncbi:tetratricopeptide repeat protein [Mucilaginibacter ginsenosidivorax]|uniref:Tetratricopeptide repeat protein n=1 Tax=Mucilaginibacter ginsenosidivorax TaxID=862126 RepID=A0A5B8W066_9SPHI|nr:tetratricopeptide repeat protein [Mucilaginibacter ginsenosidivorax]QEC75598.1 tetratricopeptide repeat protein [Mucilaginibacter ginsenosidivorax]
MNIVKKFWLLMLLLPFSAAVRAQDTDVAGLIKQGIQLNNQHDYAGAIEKYKMALTTEPDNAQANYQIAFSLNASGKGTDGIPYLIKVTKTNSSFTGPAFELLGGIYDSSHQPQQAIDAYKEGLKIKPDYQPLYFNLGIAYFRAKQFAEAEQAAIEAIKLDPKHANSQRLYGLVTFHQNKRAAALMGFCSYLLLDPEGPRSDEAYTNMQSILKGGTLKTEDAKAEASAVTLNRALNAAIAKAKPGSTPAEVLENQLKSIFEAIGQLAEKQTGNDFFRHYYADFFYSLSKTNNMSAFARLMGLSADKEANKQWLQQNEDKRKALDTWVAQAERKF